jgi:hypothetical protein
MAQIIAFVEFRQADEWHEIIDAGSLLFQHSDLNGCLFGVDNYAGFAPLFANRGIPEDCSYSLKEKYEAIRAYVSHESWVLYEELENIDWNELALHPDERIHEYNVDENGNEVFVTKWLNKPEHDFARSQLESHNFVRVGSQVFRRPTIRRRDALDDTEFPLVIKLMKVLAERFGPRAVRLVVYFE